jgi:hypothetical protein
VQHIRESNFHTICLLRSGSQPPLLCNTNHIAFFIKNVAYGIFVEDSRTLPSQGTGRIDYPDRGTGGTRWQMNLGARLDHSKNSVTLGWQAAQGGRFTVIAGNNATATTKAGKVNTYVSKDPILP